MNYFVSFCSYNWGTKTQQSLRLNRKQSATNFNCSSIIKCNKGGWCFLFQNNFLHLVLCYSEGWMLPLLLHWKLKLPASLLPGVYSRRNISLREVVRSHRKSLKVVLFDPQTRPRPCLVCRGRQFRILGWLSLARQRSEVTWIIQLWFEFLASLRWLFLCVIPD